MIRLWNGRNVLVDWCVFFDMFLCVVDVVCNGVGVKCVIVFDFFFEFLLYVFE